jgi:hypothetical protein
MMVLAFLQEGSQGVNLQTILTILGIVGPAFAGVFAALLWAQRKLVENLEKGIASCEARETLRVAAAEKKEDAALARLDKQSAVVGDLTAAVREFGPVGKASVDAAMRGTTAAERNTERLDSMRRDFDSLRGDLHTFFRSHNPRG